MAVPFLNSITLNKNEVQDFKVYNIGTGNPTLSSGGDIGYFWTDTTGSKVLKWWDGSAVRTILDSASTTIVAADLSGGSAGSLPYQQGASDTTFLGIGTAGQVLKVNSGATAPEWTAQSNLSVGTATFLAGGTAGDIPVQSAAGTTGFLNIGANGRILTSNGSTPVWSATIPSSAVSGLAASATTDTTNASNISSGTLSLGRLSLANGQFYVGDASNNPAATAKTSIPLSGFGAATADVSMGTYKITNLGTPLSTDPDSTAATKGYVDSVAQGLDVKASCVVASTTNITLASPGSITIDGVSSATFTSGVTRILVKDQSAQAENGIYIWNGTGSAMTRSLDANTWDELVGAFTFIETGTANADSGWVCNVNAGGTLGTTAVTWTKFSQAGSYTAGNGMVLSGGVFHFAQSSAYTAGQIPFCSNSPTANSIGFSSNLFWDNSNNRLGIGTATVDGKVHIYGDTYANSQLRIQRNGAVNGTFSIGVAGTNNSLYIQDEVNATARLIIDGSGNLGLAVTPAAWSGFKALQIARGSLTSFGADTFLSHNWYWSGTADTYIANDYATRYYQSQGKHIWDNGGTSAGTAGATISFATKMTLDASGRLGIGTATPAYPLDISASKAVSRLTSSTGTNGAFSFFSNTGGAFYIGLDNSAGTEFSAAYSGAIWHSGAYPIVFATSNAEKMRLDSSGNLALAATPSAWISAYRAIEIGATAGLYGRVDSTMELSLALNGYRDNSGAWVYRNNGAAALYNQNVGDHYWYTATAGTATNNISWGDAKMTLLASGNLGVGIAPAARLVSAGSSSTVFKGLILRNADGTTGSSATIDFETSSGTHGDEAAMAGRISGIRTGAGTSGAIAFSTTSGGTLGERLRLSSTGQALFSTNGTASAPTIANADNPDTGLYWPTDADTLALAVGGSDAVYIDANRNVLLGSSSDPGYGRTTLSVYNSGGGLVKVAGSATTALLYVYQPDNIAVLSTKTNHPFVFETNSTERLRIKSTGQLNFNGLASDPAGAAGDVYYNSGSNVFKVYDTGWKTLPRKYVVQLSDGSVTVLGNAYTITHNLGSQDVTVSIRRTTDNAVVQADVVMPAGGNTVTVTFAAAITAAQFYVTVIG